VVRDQSGVCKSVIHHSKAIVMLNTNPPLPNRGILRDVQILVVDNDDDSRYLCTILFESYGAKVMPIECIADALILLEHFTLDILICEIRFPNEDIWSLIQQVRAIASDCDRIIPILVASAYCFANFAQDVMANVEAHVLKPVDIDSLVGEVWNLVHPSKIACQPNTQGWVAKQRIRTKRRLAKIA